MLWKIYFAARASNGMPKSNHYKVEAEALVDAFSQALYETEDLAGRADAHLIEITDASARIITQDEYDADDGYVRL